MDISEEPMDNVQPEPERPESVADLDSIRKSLLSRVADDIDRLPLEDDEDIVRHPVDSGPSKVPYTDSKALPTKKVLIDKVNDLCDKMGQDRPKCKNWTKTQLNAYLGSLINGGMNDIQQQQDDRVSEAMIAQVQEEGGPRSINVDQGALAMYQLNIMMASLVEGVTNKEVKPRCGLYLDNLPGELEAHKENLMAAYKEVWEEYGEHLGPYLSATNRVIMINMSCGIQTLRKAHEDEKTN